MKASDFGLLLVVWALVAFYARKGYATGYQRATSEQEAWDFLQDR